MKITVKVRVSCMVDVCKDGCEDMALSKVRAEAVQTASNIIKRLLDGEPHANDHRHLTKLSSEVEELVLT